MERLRFSLPIAATINAPADVVWDALTDVPSYPSTFSGVLRVESGSTSASARSGSASAPSAQQSQQSQQSQDGVSGSGVALPEPSALPVVRRAAMGSKYRITRLSVVEGQRYSAAVTITQFDDGQGGGSVSVSGDGDGDGDNARTRSFTFSTHQMLGSTCSLKLVVEPVADYKDRKQTRTPEEETESSQHQQCRLTAIMTMIPYQFFVRLLGIMCCPCLLKSRARVAMERDVADLAAKCEYCKP